MDGCHGLDRCMSSPGQISVLSDGIAAIGEVTMQTLGAIDVGILTPLSFLICSEQLFWILAMSLAYKADMEVVGLASGRRGVFKLQNCLLAFWHVLN